VRLLGIDTPETKKPGYTVGCWGPEASAFANGYPSRPASCADSRPYARPHRPLWPHLSALVKPRPHARERRDVVGLSSRHWARRDCGSMTSSSRTNIEPFRSAAVSRFAVREIPTAASVPPVPRPESDNTGREMAKTSTSLLVCSAASEMIIGRYPARSSPLI